VLSDARLVAFVASRDLDVSHAFYAGVLGLERVETSAYANVYRTHGAELRVTRAEATPVAHTVAGWTVRDIDQAVGELTASGVAFQRYEALDQTPTGIWTSPSGARIAWFKDPDDNTLSLTERPPA
jgi:catechol 2,3-dioxygenase-like lactoylglutathione lyase family enzyme